MARWLLWRARRSVGVLADADMGGIGEICGTRVRRSGGRWRRVRIEGGWIRRVGPVSQTGGGVRARGHSDSVGMSVCLHKEGYGAAAWLELRESDVMLRLIATNPRVVEANGS